MEFKQYFLGICIGIVIFVLACTFRFIESLTLLKGLFACSVLTLVYFKIRGRSNTGSSQFSQQIAHKTPKELNTGEGKGYKRVLNLRQFIGDRILLVSLFLCSYFFLGILIGNLRVFFHEIGHLIVALSLNIKILQVFVSVAGGYVSVDGIIPLGQLNLLTISGTLWLVVVGTVFLIALYRDKKLSLTINVSLSIIIWIELASDIYYWVTGSISEIGDPLILINNNPGLHPLVITYGSLIILIILSVLVFLSLGYKIYSRFKILKSRICHANF